MTSCKYKVSLIIGKELTQFQDRFYRIHENIHLIYDVAAFEHLIEQTRECSPDEAFPLWTEAVRLYKHDFLPGHLLPWVVKRREQLRQLYSEALAGLGRVHQRRDEDERAVAFYLRALRESPDREDLYKAAMELYIKHGQHEAARALYDKLAQRLDATLKIKPSKAIRALYEQIGG